MTKATAWVAGALLAMLSSAPARAIDGFAVEGGTGEDADRALLAVQWDWKRPLLQFSNWQLGGFWDLSVSQWHASDALPGQNKDITEVGFTPVFRIQPNSLVGPYAEAAIGLHLLSRTQIGEKKFSTAFQFGDHLGFGYRFGARSAFDLGYRFQHLSNGSIKRPNNGINFHEIRLTYHF